MPCRRWIACSVVHSRRDRCWLHSDQKIALAARDGSKYWLLVTASPNDGLWNRGRDYVEVLECFLVTVNAQTFSVDRDVMVVAVAPLLGPPVHEPHPDRRVARREVLQVFVDHRGGLGRQGCSPSWHNAYTA